MTETKSFEYVKVGLTARPPYQREVLKNHPILKEDYDENKAGVVYLFERDDGGYWVGDGLQRVSKALEQNGADFKVPSYVYSGYSQDQEIELFVSWNYVRKNVSATKIFLLKAEAGDPHSADIVNIVNNAGFTIVDGTTGPLNFRGAGALQNVYGWHRKTTRPEVLNTTLRIMKDAYGDSGDATYGTLVRGIGYLVNTYDIDAEKISTILANSGSAKDLVDQVPGLTSGGQEAKVGNYIYNLTLA